MFITLLILEKHVGSGDKFHAKCWYTVAILKNPVKVKANQKRKHLVLDGFDLEVKANKREHHTLEILDQVIKASQAVRISEREDNKLQY